MCTAKLTGSSSPGNGGGGGGGSSSCGASAETRAAGVASQTHHQRGTGSPSGGLAPDEEFSTAMRDPHSM